MFDFFKKKLKSWIGKSKKEIEEKAEKIEEEPSKEEEKIEEAEVEEKEEEKVEKKEKEVEEKEKRKVEKKEKEVEERKEEKVEEIEPISREAPTIEELEKEKKPGIFKKIKEKFSYKLSEQDFENIFEKLETLLLENNVALEATESIKEELKELIGKEIKKENIEEEITSALRAAIDNILIEPDDILSLVKEKQPFIIVFFGINGTGKTTTISKLANLFLKNNITCVLAASDTFRAASIEQLEQHASKLKVKLIKHEYGADPAAVAFDAIKYAKAHNIQTVLIDTAGRMHTQKNLLNEMEKICRVTDPHLKIFVAESIAGNDAIQQAKSFNKTIGIDASILTKADVDEKGGTAISISYVTKKPILYLGTGQGLDDLKLFDKEKFIEQLGL